MIRRDAEQASREAAAANATAAAPPEGVPVEAGKSHRFQLHTVGLETDAHSKVKTYT